jgi:GNAT superfamily N-acetyltransferase
VDVRPPARNDAHCIITAVSNMDYRIRPARLGEIPTLEALIARSIRTLGANDYTPAQIEGALRGAFGVDTQLIRDQTYFVIELDEIVGCGGWSYRQTLFGGDARTERDPAVLDPTKDAAKIRAFFIDPDHSRKGFGAALLDHCEAAARAQGFAHCELMGTLPGVRLYAARGYVALPSIRYPVGPDITIEFVPMRKRIVGDP